MKKLRTRPPRFVALDNRAVDDHRLSVLDVGLLALVLRCPDGADFTVESLARKRRPGREALTGAMRNLLTCGYVVKLKIQNVHTGTWRTEFSVADMPFTPDDIADIVAGVQDARAIRVEPQWLDPRPETAPAGRTRPTGSRKSGTTSTDTEEPQVAPTDGFPTVGEPTVGNPSAKRRRRKEKDSLLFRRSVGRASADKRERESACGNAGSDARRDGCTVRVRTLTHTASRCRSAIRGRAGRG